MIFRKHICGGFGILMSPNDQVEKNLAFQCCAKMVWWLHLRSAPHILTHQITTLNDWRYTAVPLVSDAVWGCLGVSEGESWCIWVVYWDVKTALGVFGVNWELSPCRIEQCWSKPTILAQHWSFFYTSSFSNIKIPKPPHKCFLKIIGLGIF